MGNKVLVLTFASASGTKRSITINRPIDTLTPAEISSYMDSMIQTNLIMIDTEKATVKSAAKYVTQTKTSVNVG